MPLKLFCADTVQNIPSHSSTTIEQRNLAPDRAVNDAAWDDRAVGSDVSTPDVVGFA